MKTFDQHTIDSSGAFLVGELERLDKALHMPLASVTWGRDIDLRTDVTLADEMSSFTNSSFAAAGGVNPNGKNWVSGSSTEIASIAVDISKTGAPMRLWALALPWSVIELAKAEQLGRPLDQQKHAGLKLKHQMDVDEMVYVGDALLGATGLINNQSVAPLSVSNEWTAATPPDVMLDDINAIIDQAWLQSAYAVCPERLLLPPRKYSMLTRPVTSAGSKSILKYVAEECVANGVNGKPLDIQPLKWLTGRGTGGKDRAVAYTKNEMYVRFPMVPLQHTPVEFRGLHQITTYFGTLGEMEFVYPETVAYADGL